MAAGAYHKCMVIFWAMCGAELHIAAFPKPLLGAWPHAWGFHLPPLGKVGGLLSACSTSVRSTRQQCFAEQLQQYVSLQLYGSQLYYCCNHGDISKTACFQA